MNVTRKIHSKWTRVSASSVKPLYDNDSVCENCGHSFCWHGRWVPHYLNIQHVDGTVEEYPCSSYFRDACPLPFQTLFVCGEDTQLHFRMDAAWGDYEKTS
jgi:hypothetical protein